MRVPFFELPYAPSVRSKYVLLDDAPQLRLSPAFKLDEVLDFLIRAKFGRLIETLRRPRILFHKRTRDTKRFCAIHLKIDRDQREGGGEVPESKNYCSDGYRSEDDPKNRTAKHGGF
jgi:hypothetical protein